MRIFRTEMWSYAVLLIILLSIATLAVWHIISFLEVYIPPDEFKVVTMKLWSLTLGFMLIAGAFGLWAIQLSSEKESSRRIGLLVDAMDYISDSLLAIDRKGRITGSNPSAKELVNSKLSRKEKITSIFPCLSEEDLKLLLKLNNPKEVERRFINKSTTQTLRFRSQPSEGLTLIMISDVTEMETQHIRSRQRARLQLIGEIAKAVANDFSTLLTGIAGHASLLSRANQESAETKESATAITKNAERGIAMARNLLELSRSGIATGHSTDKIKEHITSAVDILRNTLPPNWKVNCSVKNQLPAAPLSGIQLEQVILNMGLLATDALSEPALIDIIAATPDDNYPLLNVPNEYASIILVSAAVSEASTSLDLKAKPSLSSKTSGVIQSVIESMIEESGGILNHFTTKDGSPIYQILLPYNTNVQEQKDTEKLPPELKAYISSWKILLAQEEEEKPSLHQDFSQLGIDVKHVDNIMSALALIQEDKPLDAMIIDEYLFKQEAQGLLKAILKLRPLAGIVVLSEEPESQPKELRENIIFESPSSSANKIIHSMIESKTLASHRKKA